MNARITCEDVQRVVDALAAGEPAAPEVAGHLSSCATCSASLTAATALERMLAARPVPEPPATFTQHVVASVRRDRWRREQVLDLGFNVTLLVVGLIITAGAMLLVYRAGVAAFALDIVDNATAELVRRAAPLVPLYGSAAALVAGALAVWWWAEKDFSV
jgi:predicted anti-sigma-YlaC factor YlaD